MIRNQYINQFMIDKKTLSKVPYFSKKKPQNKKKTKTSTYIYYNIAKGDDSHKLESYYSRYFKLSSCEILQHRKRYVWGIHRQLTELLGAVGHKQSLGLER